jgi:hypothetical protein
MPPCRREPATGAAAVDPAAGGIASSDRQRVGERDEHADPDGRQPQGDREERHGGRQHRLPDRRGPHREAEGQKVERGFRMRQGTRQRRVAGRLDRGRRGRPRSAAGGAVRHDAHVARRRFTLIALPPSPPTRCWRAPRSARGPPGRRRSARSPSPSCGGRPRRCASCWRPWPCVARGGGAGAVALVAGPGRAPRDLVVAPRGAGAPRGVRPPLLAGLRGLGAATGALLLFGAVQLTMIAAGLRAGERLGPRSTTGWSPRSSACWCCSRRG